jgi:multimeric flavodoxin WrbA
MKIIAVNGSPRKTWNTAMLLQKALEGAASRGAQAELIHLYDLNFTGCKSCFSCKTKDGKSYGKCATQDDLTPILKKLEETDAIILGSPIYLGGVTGAMKSFIERLVFPFLPYVEPPGTLFPRKIGTAIFYTMNQPEAAAKDLGYFNYFGQNERLLKRIFGSSESLASFDTYQVDDYSKLVAPRFDPVKKAARRKEVFPLDCQKAYDIGVKFATAAS